MGCEYVLSSMAELGEITPVIDSLLMTHPYLAKKFRDRSGNNLDSFGICTPEHTEYINIYNRVNEDISQQLQQIIVNQNEYSL